MIRIGLKALKCLQNRISWGLISRKLHFGQGGTCKLNLTNRTYQMKVESVWEDHCEVEIEGLTGPKNFIIEENNEAAIIDDVNLQKNPDENITLKMRIPEDYTLNGRINGSLRQEKNNTTTKLRSNETKFQIMGENKEFSWYSLQCPSLSVLNLNGPVSVKDVTFQTGKFECKQFTAKKVLFSSWFKLICQQACIRSIVAYGDAVSRVKAGNLQVESLSGACEIQSDCLTLNRLWGSPGGIKIKSAMIKEVVVETGTGYIETEVPMNIRLGRLHKGQLIKQGNKVQII